MPDAHPPLIPLGLSLGVTGHRAVALGEAGAERTRVHLREQLDALRDAVARFAVIDGRWFGAEPPKLALLSPLAPGADQIAAEAALDAGWDLKAILPFAREEYAADFPAGVARTQLDAVLARASCVLELPGVREQPAEAYRMAGRATVAHADILLAVWDGQPARGQGGTGEVVADALQRGMPVIHIPVDPGAVPAILWSRFDPHVTTTCNNAQTARRPLDEASLADLVQHLLAPPAGAEERGFLRTFAAEHERTVKWRVEYPLLAALSGARPFRRASWRTDLYRTGTRSEWSPFREGCASVHGIDAALDPLEVAYAWSDRLASHFAQTYRSGHVFNFLLGSIAVLVALTGLLLPGAKLVLALLELAVILAVIVNTAIGTRAGWHRRWLDYRQLAERLRPMRSLKLLGLAAPDLPASNARVRWIDWYAAGVWRAMGVPSGRIAPDRPPQLAASLAEHELVPQIAYHRASAAEMHLLDHRLHLTGTGLFVATIVGCLALIAGYLASPEWTARHAGIFVFLSAGLPALGTALFGIRMQGDFAATAFRSGDTAHELEAIAEQLRVPGLGLSRSGDLFEQATRTMLADLGEWRLAHHQRELQLP
ncbi:MAG TPA: DUF4231 domain-containing protein [Sphingomonas sp.]|nr:DUF4231 domain-containing protein [Sphingomonas sp.]